jgi:hypothetical protein
MKLQVATIKNRCKRREVYAKVKVEKKKLKRDRRERREREAEELGDEARPKQVGGWDAWQINCTLVIWRLYGGSGVGLPFCGRWRVVASSI